MSRITPDAEITPRTDATVCEADDCSVSKLLAEVDPTGTADSRILCPTHRVKFLREVTDP